MNLGLLSSGLDLGCSILFLFLFVKSLLVQGNMGKDQVSRTSGLLRGKWYAAALFSWLFCNWLMVPSDILTSDFTFAS